MTFRLVAVATALVGTFAAARLIGQGDTEYLALLDDYVRGEPTKTVRALASWPEARVRTVVRSLDSQLPPARLRAAVMLHTESAFEMNYGLESFHLDVARSSLRRLLDSSGPDPAARDFAARWHALTAMLYRTRNDARLARLEVNRGLRFDADHKYGNLVAGALAEYEMSVASPRKARDANLATFKYPSLSYRMIVSKYPDFFEARLRFSRELNDQNAREQLDIVVARATSPDMLYLAHMFLARLHERANRTGDAEREDEAARAVAPYPSGLIALIRIAAMRGQDEQVQALAAEIPTMAAAGHEDPWSFWNLCVTGGDLSEGLRADARRP